MGRPIIAQKRGKGGSVYRTRPFHFQPKVGYKAIPGKIVDILNDRRRDAPLARVRYQDSTQGYIIAPEGLKVGDSVENFVTTLSKLEPGVPVFCIETSPNSGPKLCRTPGSSAILISKDKGKAVIQLPSKKTKVLDGNCMVTIGLPAGEGMKEKPWVKAGKKWHAMHARGKLYPRTSPNKMNAIDHPFGGHARLGRCKSCSRNTPPGRKVGSIASKRTGKRKR